MSKTNIVDPQQVIRVVDAEVKKNLGTRGAENMDKSDYLKITANDTALAAGVGSIVIEAANADDTGTAHMAIQLKGKGTSGLTFPLAKLAASPTWAAWMEGAMYYNTTDHKVYIATNAAWVVVGSQS